MSFERARLLIAAVGLCAAVAACKSKSSSETANPDDGKTTGTPEAADTPEAATGDVGMLFDAAGYAGVVGVAVWPNEWSKISKLQEAIVAAAPAAVRQELKAGAGEFASRYTSAWSAIRDVAGELSRTGEKLPDKLEGLDESRPIVASLGASLGAFDTLGLGVVQRMTGGGQPAPQATVHRIVIPATNSGKARDALVAGLEAGGMKQRETSGAAVVLGDDRLVISVGAAKLWVEVVILSGDHLAKLSADDVAGAGKGAAATEADKLFASDQPGLLRAQLRARLMGEAGAHMGMLKVDGALGSVEDDIRALLFMQGLSEILSIFAVTDPAGAAHTDVIAEVPASNPGAVHLAAVLTAGGVAALRADAGLAANKPVAVKDIGWPAVIEAAPQPPAFAAAKPKDASQLFYECGWACMAYAVGPNGLSVLRVLFQQDKADAKQQLDKALGMAGSAADTSLMLTDSLLIVEGLAGGESRFRTAKLPAPGATAQSEADKCLYSAMRGLRKGLGVATSVDRSKLGPVVAALVAETKADLDCAAKDGAHAERVKTMRAILDAIGKAVAKD